MKRILSLTIAILLGVCFFAGGDLRAAQADWDLEIGSDDRYFSIDEQTVPDAAMRNWILENLQAVYTADEIPYFTQEQAESVKELIFPNAGIRSLQGLSFFNKLEVLNCSGNAIGAIDLLPFPNLTSLDVSDCNLSTLDVRYNTKLVSLACGNNQLIKLDLTKNTALQVLTCDGNSIAYMDLRAVKNLDTDTASLSPQTIKAQGTYNSGTYSFNLSKLMPQKYLTSVTLTDESHTFNKNTGVVTFNGRTLQFTYRFDTLKDPSSGAIELPPIPSGNSAQTRGERPRYMEVTVNLTFDGDPIQEPTLPGDANNDGKVNAADAAAVLRYLVGLSRLDAVCLLNADVDGAEGISAQDALEILRYSIGLVDVLPVA